MLTCHKCQTKICFMCRDHWHGDQTCEEAMKNQLQGWADENKDKVSFCPVCRTKIEKNKGCNHMTCYLCRYEFCWGCGGSAAGGDGHFNGNGCGVNMMDENVKPGDGKQREEEKPPAQISPCQYAFKWIGLFLLFLLLFPLVTGFYIPFIIAKDLTKL